MEKAPDSEPAISMEEFSQLPSRQLSDAEWDRLFTRSPSGESNSPYNREATFFFRDTGEVADGGKKYEVYDINRKIVAKTFVTEVATARREKRRIGF